MSEKSMKEIDEMYSGEDYDHRVIRKLYDSVTFTRGLGDGGRQVQIVEKKCDQCGYDRMIQEIHVSPVAPDEFKYRCQNPSCQNHHDGRLGLGRFG